MNVSHRCASNLSSVLVRRCRDRSLSAFLDGRQSHTLTAANTTQRLILQATNPLKEKSAPLFSSTSAPIDEEENSSSQTVSSSAPPTSMPPSYNNKGPTEESLEAQLERFISSSSTNASKDGTLDLVISLCRRNTLLGMQQAQQVVERYIMLNSSGVGSTTNAEVARFSLLLWKKVLYGWSVIAPKQPVAVVRMNEIMDRIVREAQEASSQNQPDQSGPPAIAPTLDVLNTYLWGLAQGSSSSRSAASQAHRVLKEMHTYYDTNHWWCRPNTRSYLNVLLAYKNSRLPKAGEAVLEVLELMTDAHRQQKREYEEKYGNYDQNLHCRKIVTPDSEAYTLALQAIVHSVGDTRRTIRAFFSSLPTNIDFDIVFWVAAIHAHAKLVDQGRSANARVLIARDAERLLDNASESNDKALLLSAWNACLDTWSRVYAREAPLECERLLKEMLSHPVLAPDTISFNACHYAWSRTTEFHKEAAQRSLELLQLQYDLGEALSQPDYLTYTVVILTLGNTNQIWHARQLLEDMLSRASALKPSGNPASPFSSLLTSIAKYRAPSEDADASTASAGWSDTTVEEDPYSLAVRTYTEAIQDVYGIKAKPNYHTFSAMLRCIAAHGTGTEKVTRAHEVFDSACNAGEVSRSVIAGLVAAVGESDAQQRLNDMPRFWYRNVPAGHRPHNRPPHPPRRSRQR